jgi:hypothetical protein
MVEEYSRLIREGHGERCPWRNTGCDGNFNSLFLLNKIYLSLREIIAATIHRLPLTNPETAIRNLQTRYFNLASLESKLPTYESIEVPEDVNVDDIVKMISPKFFQTRLAQDETLDLDDHTQESVETEKAPTPSSDKVGDVNKSALVLAFFGWDVVGDAAAGLAGCGACFRRLGLWMYKPKDDGNVRVYNKLEVANEHLDYCPWINAKTQSGTDKHPRKGASAVEVHSGWELLHRTIKNKYRRCAKADAEGSPRRESDSNLPDQAAIDEEAQKAKDKEWWTKLRKVRQALNIKGGKKTKPTPK